MSVDELVDLVADLVRIAHDDRAGRLLRVQRPGGSAVRVRGWVEEPVEERDVVVRSVLVDPRDRLVEHRVPEAVDRVGELGGDRRVDVGLGEGEAARTG